MSPTTIVNNINQLIQSKLLTTIPKKWQPQFQFGIRAYSLRAFHSATGNARQVVVNVNTAARKSERLLANTKLVDQLGITFDSLGLVRPNSYVDCDHSDMNGLAAFVGAVQTRKGRALPCLVETTYSDRLPSTITTPKRKQILRRARAIERQSLSFTDHYINALASLRDRLGFWPKLVFDRGFGNESLVTYLQAVDATFYIRLKAGRYVALIDPDTGDTENLIVKQLTDNDVEIKLFGMMLRIIRSSKNRRSKEPWYILTNDATSSRDKIIRIYYHRFEIEETFRDVKHIFELRRTRLNKPSSLRAILWLVNLGIALFYAATKPTNHTTRKHHKKKQISWLRQAYEQLQCVTSLLLWGEG